MAKGTYTALQQVTPYRGAMGDVLGSYERGEAAANRKLQREQARVDKENKERTEIADNFQEDYASLGEVITGTQSIDEAFARGVSKARDRIGEIYKSIERDPSLADDVNIQMKLQNLRNFSKSLSTASERYTNYATKLAQGTQDGTLSSWSKEALNTVDSIFANSNLEVGIDSRGMPFAITVKTDDNGEVIIGTDGNPVLQNLNLVEVLNGKGFDSLVPTYDMTAAAQKIGKDLGDRTLKSVTGAFSTQKVQTWDDMAGDVRGLIKGYIGTADSPSDIAKSIWSDTLGNDSRELDEDAMREIEDSFLSAVKPFYDQKVESSVDFGARNTAQENRRKAKEAAKKDTPFNDFAVVTDQDEATQKKDFVGVTGDLSGKATPFSLPVNKKTKEPNIVVTGSEGHKVVVDRIYLLDSGELAYSGFEVLGKVSGEPIDPDAESPGKIGRNLLKRSIGGGADEEDNVLTSVAKSYGLKNEGELKKLLLSKMTATDKIEFYKEK